MLHKFSDFSTWPTRGLLDRTLATAVEWANASATFEPHEILGVAWDVSERALRSAYRRLALEHHPDKGGDPVRFQLIVTAYEALMNRLHGNPEF